MHTPESVAEEIIQLFIEHGNDDYIGEEVSQIQHMTQCAMLAEAEGFDEETILAALLHDIGHLCEHIMPVERMDAFGVVDHETIGYQFLKERGFSESLAKMVASHVEAKRYLTFKFPDYYNLLSTASKETLPFQGGMMSQEEAIVFEQDTLADKYIAIRRWDDQGKNTSIGIPDMEQYRLMIIRHIQNQLS